MKTIHSKIFIAFALFGIFAVAKADPSVSGYLSANDTTSTSPVNIDLDTYASWAAFAPYPTDPGDPNTGYTADLGNYYDTNSGNVYPDNTGTPFTNASNTGNYSQIQGDQGNYGGSIYQFSFTNGSYNDDTSYNQTVLTGVSESNESSFAANYNLAITGTTSLIAANESLNFYLSGFDYSGTNYVPQNFVLQFQLESPSGVAIGSAFDTSVNLSETAFNQFGVYTVDVANAAPGDILSYYVISSDQVDHGPFDGSYITGVDAITQTVPEPSSWELMSGGLALLVGIQRFRRQNA